ncbi:MAG: SGNH/GDSL hydrolase family protein [Clostridia bacterium]|nr:SGNH/GDSL hydrolase family protein [Clostridia bacterium]
MKLSENQVKQIAFGYFSIGTDGGEFVFHRFSSAQEQYYLETSPRDFYKKALATSGVNLDFVTDSASFGFSYSVSSASSRRFYYFDIYIDNVLKYHFGEEKMWINRSRIEIPLPEGEHRVTVWLPCLAAARLSDLTLDDGASLRPVVHSRKMVCFGDSITQGYDAWYPSLDYTNRLAQHFDADMINLAIGGEKFVPGILDPAFGAAFKPDIITVAYGTNDWSGFERELFESRCVSFLEGLPELFPGAKIFILTPIWRGDHKRLTKVGTFEEACAFITETAERCGLTVISGNNLVPHYEGFFSDLRLHPNDLGYGEYVRNLIPEIEKGL